MDTTCHTCQHWQPRQSGQLAKHGFALCAKGPRWQFLPPQHRCDKHHPAAPAVATARAKWFRRFIPQRLEDGNCERI